MVRTLVEGKTPLDFVDDDGYTPLALAITRCDASVAMYLIEQGADPRVMGSGFGSILHLAVRQGSLKLVKRLMEAGADFEKVHPDHTESLLHAALGITNVSTMRRMVRYLVDEAKFPVDKFGGEFGYPIIRAAFLIRMENPAGLDVLKFLIRRKAQLNVADSQGRRAVHLVSTAATVAGTKALVAAGADINVRDKFGRLPIHFAASSPSQDSLFYLLDKFPDMDIDAGDYDKWTPLLWAARSGDENSVLRLVDQGANLWTRGTTAHSRTEWSALKLINFANFPGRSRDLADKVVPKELYRTSYNGGKEYWDEYSHKSKPGHITNYICDGCLVVSEPSFIW
jgi:ankyrin repeat protein